MQFVFVFIDVHVQLSTGLTPIVVYVMWPRVWGKPKATEHTKECLLLRRAGLLTDLTIPQLKAVAAYRLYGPAQTKRINYERRQMHTYCNKWPLRPRGSLLPYELKCQHSRSAADCTSLKCLQQQKLQD